MVRRTSVLMFLIVTFLLPVRQADAQACVAGGEFVPTRAMSVPRQGHVAERLPDGRVLLAGSSTFTTHSEVFDPVSETLSAAGALNVGRCYGCGATALPSGDILVAGGWTGGGPVLTSAEIFDAAAGAFRFTGSMVHNRLGPNLHRLNDGRVLALGGHTGFTPRSSAEIFDPATETWSLTGSMTAPRLPSSVTLADGRVLVVGGLTNTGAYLKTVDVYQPTTGTFVPTGSMATGRYGHTATLMADGRVLVTGGMTGSQGNESMVASAEIYDPATGQFNAVSALSAPRAAAVGFLLPDGRVVLAGGLDTAFNRVASTEVFDPVTLSFSPGPPMVTARSSFAVTALTDGRVLISGGHGANGRLAAMEIFVPCNPDSTAPVVSVPGDLTVEATGPDGAAVTFAASAADDIDGPLAVSCTPQSGATFALGETTVTCSATDAAGNTGSNSFTVAVVDTTAPVIADVTPSQSVLWAPNHKMRAITFSVSAADAVSATSCSVVSVTSNEPVNGLGDGDTGPDWEITGALAVNLRAERSGNGSGRIYTVTVSCSDAAGNASSANATVSVPRDRR